MNHLGLLLQQPNFIKITYYYIFNNGPYNYSGISDTSYSQLLLYRDCSRKVCDRSPIAPIFKIIFKPSSSHIPLKL